VADRSLLAINPVIYAEVSIGFERVEALEYALPAELRRESLPWDAAFLAGQAFLAYKRKSGTRRSTLPDFFIGAHAAVRGYALLTRDARRYRSYFPTVDLIFPEG
jgi:predicted nucleic acid-binding protein